MTCPTQSKTILPVLTALTMACLALSTAQQAFAVSRLVDAGYPGRIAAAGGDPLASAQAPAARIIWSLVDDLNIARPFHTATLLPNGQVVVAGGEGVGGSLASAEQSRRGGR